MAKRHPIDLKLSGVVGADNIGHLRTKAFKPGGLLCLQRAVARTPDDANCLIDVGFERQGQTLCLACLETAKKNKSVATQGPVYAPSDYEVVFQFSDLSAGDRIEAYVFGYWTDFPE